MFLHIGLDLTCYTTVSHRQLYFSILFDFLITLCFNNCCYLQIRYLCLQSGASLGDGVRRMLRKIGLNSLWKNYSYKGRKGKRAFQPLLITDVIIREFTMLLSKTFLSPGLQKVHCNINVVTNYRFIVIDQIWRLAFESYMSYAVIPTAISTVVYWHCSQLVTVGHTFKKLFLRLKC